MKWTRINRGLRRAIVPNSTYACEVSITFELVHESDACETMTCIPSLVTTDDVSSDWLASGGPCGSIEEAEAEAMNMMCEQLAQDRHTDEGDISDFEDLVLKLERENEAFKSEKHNLEQNLAMLRTRCGYFIESIRKLRLENERLQALGGLRGRLSAAVHGFIHG
jgi:hypothetical protein